MQANKQLSIVIPTYNRANFLDYSFSVHIALIKKYNIEIIVFDNNSDDDTSNVIDKWSREYKYIKYIKHDKNIGSVENFGFALKYASTEYIWLLGDTYQFYSKNVEYLLEILQKNKNFDVDAIVYNLGQKLKIKSQQYNDKNLLLNNLGALMTCAAVTVINRKIVQDDVFKRYRITNFPQLGLIFEYLSNKDFICVEWINEASITGLKSKSLNKTNWSHTPKAFEIGCEDWTNFVMSLPPSYTLENKLKCIMDFGKVSSLFSLKKLIQLREQNLLNYDVYRKYKKYFQYTIDYPIWLIFCISIFPRKFFEVLIKVHNKYKGR